MQFEISLNKADEIVLSFLKENGFSEHARIKRYLSKSNKKIDISDVYIEDVDQKYSDNPTILTKISNYNKLLFEVLQLSGSPVSGVSTRITSSGVSFIISTMPTEHHRRGR